MDWNIMVHIGNHKFAAAKPGGMSKVHKIHKRLRKVLKLMSLIAFSSLLLLCNGCNRETAVKVTDDNGKEPVTATATPIVSTPTADVVAPTQAAMTPTPTEEILTPTPEISSPDDPGNHEDNPGEEAAEKFDLTAFKKLKDCFIDYQFDVVSNGTGDMPDSFDVHGEYDLNQDGRLEEISLYLLGNTLNSAFDVKTYIEINGIRKDFYMDYSEEGEVDIVDLDQKDSYLEVAYFDAGPSDDPHYHFYRYDGKEVIELGETDSSALIDGYGKEIPFLFTSGQFTPVICSGYKIIENNAFKVVNLDIKNCLGKTYKFSGGDAFFQPCDAMPDNLELNWDMESMIHLDPCQIKILDIKLSEYDRLLNWYFVELPDGQKGLLYFWIGD
jgi:hypothetical protein